MKAGYYKRTQQSKQQNYYEVSWVTERTANKKEVQKLTDEQSSVHVGIFPQQLFTDVNSWIILILNAQQDLILETKTLKKQSADQVQTVAQGCRLRAEGNQTIRGQLVIVTFG